MNEDDYPEDKVEEHTVASRQQIRNQLNDEIAEFLARGGQIQQVDPSVSAPVTFKPGGEYGRQAL